MHIQGVVVGVNKQRFSVDLSLKPSHLRYAHTNTQSPTHSFIHSLTLVHWHTTHKYTQIDVTWKDPLSPIFTLLSPFFSLSFFLHLFHPLHSLLKPVTSLRTTEDYWMSARLPDTSSFNSDGKIRFNANGKHIYHTYWLLDRLPVRQSDQLYLGHHHYHYFRQLTFVLTSCFSLFFPHPTSIPFFPCH